jgi:AraC-like DNA-binding protein
MKSHSHSHAQPEVLFVLSGRGHHGLAGKIYPIRPGTVCFFDAFEKHDVGNSPQSQPGIQLWCAFLRGRILAWLTFIDRTPKRNAPPWRRLFTQEELGFSPDRLLWPRQQADAISPEAQRMQMVSVLFLLASAIAHSRFELSNAPPSKAFQQDVISAICNHVQETGGRGSNIENLARLAGYSKFHFLRIFRKHTGRSVHQYIDSCRVTRAQEMLAQGSRKKAIAAALGFSHQSAFTRWHKRQLEWR